MKLNDSIIVLTLVFLALLRNTEDSEYIESLKRNIIPQVLCYIYREPYS